MSAREKMARLGRSMFSQALSARRWRRLRDARLLALLLALACAVLGLFDPHLSHPQRRFDALFVVDITGSMMVRDYRRGGEPESRLERVKSSLQRLLADMPCGSRAGLAVFSERQPFLLVAPVETCANFAPLAGTVGALDWRMAWEGDSFVAVALYRALDLAERYETDLVFLTDGHEAPPLPFSGPPPFEREPGRVRGMIVGVGDDALSPIPRFDAEGREAGFLAADEVIQENRVGLPPPEVQQREGYEPRNAPWGAAAATGEEHLSSVREPYLRRLADITGLGYVRLEDRTDLLRALTRHSAPRQVMARTSLSPWLAGLGLAALVFAWGVVPLRERYARRRPPGLPSNHPPPQEIRMPSRLFITLVAALAVASSALAHGPTPRRAAETVLIGKPVADVWAAIQDFGGIAEWNPLLTASEADKGNQIGSERVVTFASGGTLTDSLDQHDPEAGVIAWRLLREDVEVFPVSSYSMRLTVREADGGSEVEWSATFFRADTHNDPPEHLSDEAAEAAVRGYFRAGLEQLKAELED